MCHTPAVLIMPFEDDVPEQQNTGSNLSVVVQLLLVLQHLTVIIVLLVLSHLNGFHQKGNLAV